MSLSKHKKIPTYDFPEEILSEVFKRLPVKYVLRCGAVQKSWYSLIKSPMFISLHSKHQILTAHVNPKYLLFHNTSTQLFTVRSDDAQSQEYCTFEYSLDLPNEAWNAHSNGLVCVSNMFDEKYRYNRKHCYNPDIYLWNPLVQKFKAVPDSPLCTFKCKEIKWRALAFGFLPEVNDYVVIHVVKPKLTSEPKSFDFCDLDPPVAYRQYPHSVVIGVYSLNTNSWKKLSQDKVFVDGMTSDQSVFVNGTAYWVGSSDYELSQLIMCFDTKTNILQKIMLPSWLEIFDRQLINPLIFPFGQSIAYFIEVDEDDAKEEEDGSGSPHLDIWVLKDNMEREDDLFGELPWEKKMSVGLSENVWVEVLGIRNNGEPILAKSNNLISYDLDTHEPYDFVESCDRLTPRYDYEEGSKPPFIISPFVETLVLLDID
ncbi:hypothetical protein POM88_037895 [Heracleum sosnowskyi]|uniref:F-box domain-containing protein n=1 Tax=Heracleum sosnowskyi TaxID=360622 RepID=A0AAD8HT46_9APIA|nr:hypothetical protein POM88_037895 [Heracleum sosnowskyi]